MNDSDYDDDENMNDLSDRNTSDFDLENNQA